MSNKKLIILLAGESSEGGRPEERNGNGRAGDEEIMSQDLNQKVVDICSILQEETA